MVLPLSQVYASILDRMQREEPRLADWPLLEITDKAPLGQLVHAAEQMGAQPDGRILVLRRVLARARLLA